MARRVKNAASRNSRLPDVYLVCEGDDDVNLLAVLAQKILRRNHADMTVAVVPAYTKLQIRGISHALDNQAEGKSRLGIVVDSNGQMEAAKSFLRRNLDLENYFVVIADPSVESWFGKKIKRLADDPKQVGKIVNQLDLDEIERKHPEVAMLRENLRQPPANGSAAHRKNTSHPLHSHG